MATVLMNSISEISSQDNSKMIKIHQYILGNLFILYDYMLKNNNNDILLIRYFLLIFEYLNLFSNIFHDEYFKKWSSNSTMRKISQFASYINIVKFAKSKKKIYYIIFNIVIIMMLSIQASLFITSFNIKTNTLTNQRIISLFKFFFPLFSELFFTQIFTILISIFYCEPDTSYSYYDPTIKCFSGVFNKIEIILGIISILLLLHFSYTTLSFYYIPIYDKGNLKKLHTLPDKIFLITKIIIISLHTLLLPHNDDTKSILIVSIIITFTNFYMIYKYKSCNNNIINLIHKIFSLILFFGFLSLLIGKICSYFGFNGTSYLLVVIIILIIIYIFSEGSEIKEFFMLNFSKINSPIEYISYISKIISVIDSKDDSRENFIILNSTIERSEKLCRDPFCVLKNYMGALEKGIECKILLYINIQKLFKLSISKFNHSIILKIAYIYFLIKKLNKRKEAQIIFESIDKNSCSVEELFLYFRCEKFLVITSLESSKLNSKKKLNKDIVETLEYSKNLSEFKSSLSKISLLYSDFWSSLLDSHSSGEKPFKKISNIGTKILKMINPIKENYMKLFNIKNNNRELNLIYFSFIKNVLDNKQYFDKHISVLKGLNIDNFIYQNQTDFSNFDLKSFNVKNEIQYLIITGDNALKKKTGIIKDISLSLIPVLGYQKNEIVGKNITEIIPEILQDAHDKMLNDLTNDIKTNFYYNLSLNNKYIPNTINKNGYCRNKSQCLIPFNFQAIYVQNEQNDLLYILNVFKKDAFPNSYNKKNGEETICCVLTDENFFIQSFTPNAFEYLNFNTNYIKAKINICSFIQEFQEEIIQMEKVENNQITNINILENNSINGSTKLLTKISANSNNSLARININKSKTKLFHLKLKQKEQLIKYYETPQIITWKIKTKNSNLYEEENIDIKHQSHRTDIIDKSYEETKFELTIKECKISKKLLGYKFLFKKIINQENNSKDKYIIKFEEIKPEFNAGDSIISAFSSTIISNINLNNPTDDKKNKNTANKSRLSLCINPRLSKDLKFLNNQIENNQEINENAKNSALSFQNEMDLINEKNEITVDKNFIPKSAFNFVLDIDEMNFKSIRFLNFNNLTTKFNEKLKKEANDKILKNNIPNTQEKESISSNSSSSKSSESESSESSSEIQSSSNSNNFSENQNSDNNKENKIITKIANEVINKRKSSKLNGSFNQLNKTNNEKIEYYKVNLNNIRYMCYDFNKDVVTENETIEKKSKIEEILHKIKQKCITIGEEENFPFINIENYKNCADKKKANKKLNKKETGEKNELLCDQKSQEEKNKLDKEIEFEKVINEEINKKEKQLSVTILIIADIICSLILIGLGIYNLILVLSKVNIDYTNLELICQSSVLGIKNNYAYYYIRELSLLNFPKVPYVQYGEYTLIPYNGSKTDYIAKIKNDLFEIYKSTYSLTQFIITSNIKLSQNVEYVLTKKEDISHIYLDSSAVEVKTTFFGLLVEANSQLFNLATSINPILSNNMDLRGFCFNFVNYIEEGLQEQVNLLVEEIAVRKNKTIKIIIITIFTDLLILIIITLILRICIKNVIAKKNSYIDALFGIGMSVIENSLKKCEFFINQIKKIEIYDKCQDNKKNEGNLDEFNEFISSKRNDNPSFANDYSNLKRNQKNEKKITKSKISKTNNYKESLIYLILIIIIGIISLSFFIFGFVDYLYNVDNIQKNAKFLFHYYRYNNYIPTFFNTYREVLMNEKLTVRNNQTTYEVLKFVENNIYTQKSEDLYLITLYMSSIKNFVKVFNSIVQSPVCAGRTNDYFASDEECLSYMNGIMSYDFNTITSSFFEEIILQAKNVLYYIKENDVIDIKADVFIMSPDTLKDKIFRYIFFENENIGSHHKLNVIFSNVYIPGIIRILNVIIMSILDNYTDITSNFYIAYISYFCFLFLVLFCFILPKVLLMNSVIFQSKIILKIIPNHILVNLKGISELLNLSRIDNVYH